MQPSQLTKGRAPQPGRSSRWPTLDPAQSDARRRAAPECAGTVRQLGHDDHRDVSRVGEHLLLGAEMLRRVGIELLLEIGNGSGEAGVPCDRLHLPLDACHFLLAEPMNIGPRQPRRRQPVNQNRVRGASVFHGRDAVRRPHARQVRLRHVCSQLAPCRKELLLEGLERLAAQPVLIGSRQVRREVRRRRSLRWQRCERDGQ